MSAARADLAPSYSIGQLVFAGHAGGDVDVMFDFHDASAALQEGASKAARRVGRRAPGRTGVRQAARAARNAAKASRYDMAAYAARADDAEKKQELRRP